MLMQDAAWCLGFRVYGLCHSQAQTMTEVPFSSPFVCSSPATKSMMYCEDSQLPWCSCQMLNGAGFRV
jgi:hypothetical protein